MWSNKKYIDYIINGLLFLMGMNFLHYGQFALPIMCLILFIDNRFKLVIKNKKIFTILCLFAITYFIFSFDQGFYSVMGFCLPLAYYVGSNIKNNNEDSVITIIYCIAFGMSTHLILNMAYELISFYNFDVLYMLTKRNHYDIWVQDIVNTTGTAVNCVFIYTVFYYSIKHEKDRKFKILSIILCTLSAFYGICLGRRTSLFIFIIAVGTSLCLDYGAKIKTYNKKTIIKVILIAMCSIMILVLLYVINAFKFRDAVENLFVVKKLISYGLSSGRIEILLDAIKIAPNHLFGGGEISNELNSWIHDLWGDIYDQAGIIPYLLMIVYSVDSLKNIIKLYIENDCLKFKNLILVWFLCITLIMFLEPVMSGCSIFLICTIVVLSSIKSINH